MRVRTDPRTTGEQTNEALKTAQLTAIHFQLYKTQLTQNDLILWKYSHILEPWIEIYDPITKSKLATLPPDIFKREFRLTASTPS